jgi:hypothetical protein
MLFMIMHKNDPKTEAGEKPPMELVQKMGALMGSFMREGRFKDGAGLQRSHARTRLTFKNGDVSIKSGPYSGEHELPHAALLLKVTTKQEAIGWCERYGKLLGDGEIELGSVVEPWDLGVVPKPAEHPLQFLLIEKVSPATESGSRSSKQKADLSRLKTEMTKAGVLQRQVVLQPSTKARRLFFTHNDLRTVDGPFAESKELIGGFCVIEFATVDDAVAMCRGYASILGGTLEIDIRQVDTSEDAA